MSEKAKAKEVEIIRWEKLVTRAAVYTNRDVQMMLRAESDELSEQLLSALASDCDKIGDPLWAISTGKDEHAGALVAVVSLPLRYTDPTMLPRVDALVLTPDGPRQRSFCLNDLRPATADDLAKPAVLAEELPW